jgi:hypothetical protein
MKMKFRHASPLALVGWYLIMPPRCPTYPAERKPCRNAIAASFPWLDTGAPVARWHVVSVFENADACNAALMAALDALTKQDDNNPAAAADDPYLAQCIATDDPRLK